MDPAAVLTVKGDGAGAGAAAPAAPGGPGGPCAPRKPLRALMLRSRTLRERSLTSLERTAPVRICRSPTLFRGSVIAAYEVPPIATIKAVTATTIDGEIVGRRRRILTVNPSAQTRRLRCLATLMVCRGAAYWYIGESSGRLLIFVQSGFTCWL